MKNKYVKKGKLFLSIRLYIEFNLRDKACFFTKKGQVYKGVIYDLHSLQDYGVNLFTNKVFSVNPDGIVL